MKIWDLVLSLSAGCAVSFMLQRLKGLLHVFDISYKCSTRGGENMLGYIKLGNKNGRNPEGSYV